jgi:hypothetical protein
MKKSLLFAMALGVAFAACSKEEVPLYDTENVHFIEFVAPTEDTATFSFMFHPEVEAGAAYDLAIPVKILGQANAKDREYKVTVVDSLTSATEGTHFTMPEKFVFRAGLFEDTLFVKLHRTADLKTVKVTLGLRIENNNVFYAGQTTYRESIWVISDQISQPAWWTTYATDRYESVEYMFLGEYSDKKYGLLIEVTGVSDWTDLSTDERRVLALQLKRYLAKNIVYEDVESAEPVRMTVTVMG